MKACHSQQNTYGAHRKIWATFLTRGEQSCGTLRYSRLKPEGDKLNNTHLSRATAEYVARRVPGGGVIFQTSGETFDVFSEQRILRFREILQRVKRSHQ